MARRRWLRKPVAKALIAGAIITLSVVAAYAAVNYFGIQKSVENVFTPAVISLAVQESGGDTSGTSNQESTYSNTYTWSKETGTEDSTTIYTANKGVSILNVDKADENNADAYVRVCILPQWVTELTISEGETDTSGAVVTATETVEVGNHDGLASFGTMDSIQITENTYTFGDVTFTLDNNWSDYWIYNPVDGWFYYKTILSPGQTTKQLLASVSISEDIKTILDANGIELSVEILTDSIQTEAGALDARWSDAQLTIGDDGALETKVNEGGEASES